MSPLTALPCTLCAHRQHPETWLMLIEASNCNITPAVLSSICHLGPSRQNAGEIDSGRGSEARRDREGAASRNDGNRDTTKVTSCVTSPSKSARRARGGGSGAQARTHTLHNSTNHPGIVPGNRQKHIVDFDSKHAYSREAESAGGVRHMAAQNSHITVTNNTVLTQPPMR
jgi:hypothetical protein